MARGANVVVAVGDKGGDKAALIVLCMLYK
ncbi:hypothetical protein Q7M_1304 (plasmid) [Borrelia crocidurae str. Achema]|uniref:Uncharacterized protein n=1 Tax=Borrelia crocidurae (strain Achema) TaxID=1155096 RepID=I0FF04_BORCA|nr:hypothetical protein Q7M_1304 [Borrelia crocidurae str. Achema]